MRTCLVVDDSRAIRKIAIKMLNGFGFECDEAENGAIALEKCTSKAPDVVLLDWNMPVMDGMTFLKKLRSSDITPQPKVLLCTTENEMSKVVEAISQGADEYIMKPFDEEILFSKLKLIQAV